MPKKWISECLLHAWTLLECTAAAGTWGIPEHACTLCHGFAPSALGKPPDRLMAGVLTPVCRRPGVQRVDDAGAVGVLLGCSAQVLRPVRLCLGGSARASMVLLQVFALLRVVGLHVHRNAVDSDQSLPR